MVLGTPPVGITQNAGFFSRDTILLGVRYVRRSPVRPSLKCTFEDDNEYQFGKT
jgi:hypothetical protein